MSSLPSPQAAHGHADEVTPTGKRETSELMLRTLGRRLERLHDARACVLALVQRSSEPEENINIHKFAYLVLVFLGANFPELCTLLEFSTAEVTVISRCLVEPLKRTLNAAAEVFDAYNNGDSLDTPASAVIESVCDQHAQAHKFASSFTRGELEIC